MRKVYFLVIALLAFMLGACAKTPESSTPTLTYTAVPATPTPTAIPASPTPEAAAEEYLTSIQLGDPLPDEGAWLLVQIDFEYYLLSEDGERRIELDPSNHFSDDYIVSFIPSPTGEMVAILVGNKALGTDKNLFLWFLSENSVAHIAELYNHENFSELTFEEKDNIYFSTGQVTWSHEGSKLAFASAHLGSSTDLYVYDLETEGIRRLTSGPTQAVNLVWSPDDAYILHAGVEKLWYGYSGRGYSGWQFFSAAADGSQVNTLAAGRVEGRGDEEYLGWVSDRHILIHSGYWFCGWFDLRIMDIVSGEEYVIYPENHNGIAYSPEADLALMYINEAFEGDVEKCGHKEFPSGLRLISIPDGQVIKEGFGTGYYEPLTFNGDMPFFIQWDEQWYTVDTQGNIESFEGDPYLPEQFWDLSSEIDWVYGWVSAGGL
jgi:hypothetical protein